VLMEAGGFEPVHLSNLVLRSAAWEWDRAAILPSVDCLSTCCADRGEPHRFR